MGEECDLFPTVQRKETISEMTGSDVTKEECYTEPNAYMWQIDGGKERVFIPSMSHRCSGEESKRSKVCCEKSASSHSTCDGLQGRVSIF